MSAIYMKKLSKILKEQKLWLQEESLGRQADFYGLNLSEANLYEPNLYEDVK